MHNYGDNALSDTCINLLLMHYNQLVTITVYWEALTKEKYDKFDESQPNHQTKTIQYKATISLSKISAYFYMQLVPKRIEIILKLILEAF